MATPSAREVEPGCRAQWLIVEDESLIAMMIEDALTALGLAIAGPISRVGPALRVAATAPLQGAILDVNVAGELVFPVAAALAARDVPFLFVTGYGEAVLPEAFADRPLLQKPFATETVQAAIRRLLESSATKA